MPASQITVGKSNQVTLPLITSKRHKPRRSPSYLYLKGNIFYFRYAFHASDKLRLGVAEVRMSLRTGFEAIAKKNAQTLRVLVEDLMKENAELSIDELKLRLSEKLQALIDAQPKKSPPSINEIKRRMDVLRKKMLDDADSELYRPESSFSIDSNGNFITVSPEEGLEANYISFMRDAASSPERLLAIHYPQLIIRLLSENIFALDELTEQSILQIINEFHKMQISLNRIFKARENGDFSYERNFDRAFDNISNTKFEHYTQNTSIEKKKESIQTHELSLSSFISQYKDIKISDKQWTEHNVATHINRLEAIIDILGDRNIHSITREDMRDLRSTLEKLPPRRKQDKRYKGKSISEILTMNPDQTLDVKTVNVTMEAISSMFEWGVRERIVSFNPAKGLSLKDERQDIEKKEPFTNEDLQKLFFAGDYTQDKFKHPSFYWVPIIGLFTGMRLEEICQLHCNDIKLTDGIWYFDINRNPLKDGTIDKIVKTKNAIRTVPIHEYLIKLGFIDFVKSVSINNERLFFELNKTERSPKYGKQVGKNFSKLLKEKGIKDKKSFHSLRHTFSDFFKKKNMHSDIFRQVFGHDIKELAGSTYGSKFSVKQCYNELIQYINWNELKS